MSRLLDRGSIAMLAAFAATVATCLFAGPAQASAPRGEPGWYGCTVNGTGKADVLVGTTQNDVICAGAGNDTITGGGGIDTVYAGTGNDRITGSNPPKGSRPLDGDSLFGGDGNDVISGLGGDDRIEGQGGVDVIHGGAGADSIYGYYLSRPAQGTQADGADLVYGESGNDYIWGGPGDDYLSGGSNTVQDIVHGQDGDDVLIGGVGTFADEFWGDGGNDVLLPFPARLSPLGSGARGGEGFDVIVTLNGLRDFYDPDPKTETPLSQACTVQVTTTSPAATKNLPYAVKCKLPWPKMLGHQSTVRMTVEKGSDGKTVVGGDVGGIFDLSVADWTKLRQANRGALTGDVTLVDPVSPDPRRILVSDFTW